MKKYVPVNIVVPQGTKEDIYLQADIDFVLGKLRSVLGIVDTEYKKNMKNERQKHMYATSLLSSMFHRFGLLELSRDEFLKFIMLFYDSYKNDSKPMRELEERYGVDANVQVKKRD